MDCNTCKDKTGQSGSVPFVVFESTKATMERTIKRLWILAIILIVLLFGTNAAWIYYESQWEVYETSIEAEQITDGGGNNYAIGGDVYGQTEG